MKRPKQIIDEVLEKFKAKLYCKTSQALNFSWCTLFYLSSEHENNIA